MGFNFVSFSRKKEITVYTNTHEFTIEFFHEMINKIQKAAIHEIKKESNEISYKGPLFRFAWNGWNLFNPISSGKINLTNSTNSIIFRYKIFFTEYLFIALFFSVIPIFNSFRVDISVILITIIWIIFYLGSCGLSIIRYNALINKTIEKVYQNQIKGI